MRGGVVIQIEAVFTLALSLLKIPLIVIVLLLALGQNHQQYRAALAHIISDTFDGNRI
jgi:hypothetical protein